ncbi:hypothetical protein P152DRAFT_455474 [Eremomyces bilateralis CBS 781.70]|uniref:Uncharacterized protein n=1 Tax=Eremomyces bilateralis CBS 781.70 TaxID=1392243 RepID=A0A6G1GCY1_9PEZI|nr:uncharacterized protein P152DRAFT_455474 [Eremomyces bilateralis CBS 781.70]KAF1815760.1 hypothetical protein P152DRAFT_455474 [Eremomyces bilateralis CBS 781.70]
MIDGIVNNRSWFTVTVDGQLQTFVMRSPIQYASQNAGRNRRGLSLIQNLFSRNSRLEKLLRQQRNPTPDPYGNYARHNQKTRFHAWYDRIRTLRSVQSNGTAIKRPYNVRKFGGQIAPLDSSLFDR